MTRLIALCALTCSCTAVDWPDPASLNGTVVAVDQWGQVESPARAGEMAKLLGDAKALMLRGHGAVVVGQSIREVCMLALFLEESARLQSEAMRLGTPMFMERDEALKISKRTFKPTSVERALEHFAAKCAE